MRGLVVVGVALLALAAAPAARGAVTIGSTLDATPEALPLDCAPDGCSFSPSLIPNRQVSAPITGVVTRWRIRSGATVGLVALQVLRQQDDLSGGQRIDVGRSARVTPPQNDTSEHATRIPIQAGDFIALDCCSAGPADYFGSTEDTEFLVWRPPVGADPAAPEGGSAPGEILVAADIESDADGDGFGDETQDSDDDGDGVADSSDACPATRASGADGCPPTPPPAAPRVNQPPTVRFRTPLAGTAIGPSQTIELEVSDDAGNPTVTLFDDDGTICTLSGPPYSCTWSPTGADVGRATLLASAVDSAGRSTLGIVRVRVKRFAADLTARRRGRRVSGRLLLPAAVTRSLGCRGDVTVRRRRVRRTVELKRNCTYSVRFPRGRGTQRARFAGNAVVQPAT